MFPYVLFLSILIKESLTREKPKPAIVNNSNDSKELQSQLWFEFKKFEREPCEIEKSYKQKYLGKEIKKEDIIFLMQKIKHEIKTGEYTWDTYVHMSVLTRRICKGKMIRKQDWHKLKEHNQKTELKNLLLTKELFNLCL